MSRRFSLSLSVPAIDFRVARKVMGPGTPPKADQAPLAQANGGQLR